MYVCGPTVYNYIHIGNARSAIAFDTVRRYLEFKGYQVNYVSNFTDVDDKMIKAAAEQGITVPQLADKFIKAFMEDTAALNIEPATKRPRAKKTMLMSKMATFIIGRASLSIMASFPDSRSMIWKPALVSILQLKRFSKKRIL